MKKKNSFKQFYLFMVLFALLLSNMANAQTSDSKNLNAWSTVSIEYKPNKKWSFELPEHLRLKENLSLLHE